MIPEGLKELSAVFRQPTCSLIHVLACIIERLIHVLRQQMRDDSGIGEVVRLMKFNSKSKRDFEVHFYERGETKPRNHLLHCLSITIPSLPTVNSTTLITLKSPAFEFTKEKPGIELALPSYSPIKSLQAHV